MVAAEEKWSFQKDWIRDPPAHEFFDLENADEREEFIERYVDVMDGGEAVVSILELLAQTTELSCIVERNYIDRDYRDEFANFYAQTFASLVDRCQRLHFVSAEGYLGYVVLRPIRGRLISRTMLAPPSAMKSFVSCLGRGSAIFEETREYVEAAPFISQDFQYGTCAHAAIWMVAHYFHLRFGAPRHHMSDIVQGTRIKRGNHRITPSRGLSTSQIVGVMDELGMLPLNYPLMNDEARKGAHQIARSYLDSEIPVILTVGRHAKVLVGYFHDEDGKRYYIAHDDMKGPYRLLESLDDVEYLLVPAPGRIYLEFITAMKAAQFHFEELIEENGGELAAKTADDLQLRAYVTEIGDYRERLAQRELATDARAWLGLSNASHWVWVVELEDKVAARQGRKCVIGEMVVDATTDQRSPHVLFGIMPGRLFRWAEPKQGQTEKPSTQTDLFVSGCAIHSFP